MSCHLPRSGKLSNSLELQAIHRFQSTAAAVEDITAIQDGRLSSSLQEFLTSSIAGAGADGKKSKKSKSIEEKLIVSDPKLAGTINKALNIPVVSDSSGGMQDLYRGIREQLGALLGGVEESDLSTMRLGLGHSLSRWVMTLACPILFADFFTPLQVQVEVLYRQGRHHGHPGYRFVGRSGQGNQHL